MITEEMKNLLFTKKQLQKLKILTLFKKRYLTLDILKDSLAISNRNAKLLIKEFSEEVNNFFYQSKIETRLIVNNGFYYFRGKGEDTLYLNDYLRHKFAKASPVYNLFLFVLEKRKFKIFDVSEFLIYSESHSYKIIDKVSKILEELDLGIELTRDTSNTYHVDGDESCIRLLHFFTIIRVFRGQDWPFIDLKFNEVVAIQKYLNQEKFDKLSINNRMRFNYLIAIYENALKQNRHISKLSKEVIEIGNLVNREKKPVYLKIFLSMQKESTNSFDNELIHLSFIVNYQIQELRSREEKVEIGRMISMLKKNKIVAQTLKIMDGVEQISDKLEENDYYELVYGICGRIITIHHLGYFKFQKNISIPSFTGEAEKEIQRIIDDCLSQYHKSESYSSLSFSILQYIIGYTAPNVEIKQRVYLEFYFKQEYKSILQKFISKIYDSSVIEVVENYYDADIVISDIFSKRENVKFFYLDDIFNTSKWDELGQFINDSLRQEIIKKAKLTKR